MYVCERKGGGGGACSERCSLARALGAVGEDFVVAGIPLQVVPLNEVLNPLFYVAAGGLKAHGELPNGLHDKGPNVQALARLHDAHYGGVSHCLALALHLRLHILIQLAFPATPRGALSTAAAAAAAAAAPAATPPCNKGGGRDEGDAHAEELGRKPRVDAKNLLGEKLLAL